MNSSHGPGTERASLAVTFYTREVQKWRPAISSLLLLSLLLVDDVREAVAMKDVPKMPPAHVSEKKTSNRCYYKGFSTKAGTIACTEPTELPKEWRLPFCALFTVGDILPSEGQHFLNNSGLQLSNILHKQKESIHGLCPTHNLAECLDEFNRTGSHECLIWGSPSRNESVCERCLDLVLFLDTCLRTAFESSMLTLQRHCGCQDDYAMRWRCDACETAYRDWFCAENLPFYREGVLKRPCGSFCLDMERSCPYLLPDSPYAGESGFSCPGHVYGVQAKNIPKDNDCYTKCDLKRDADSEESCDQEWTNPAPTQNRALPFLPHVPSAATWVALSISHILWYNR
ncbi:FAM155B [Branchiostoma lanceolatum]|uniref:FAM155B protein n=1 Tax=Branchiostoma lanceolatum TaxID=7740 RepID=A0A8J9Z036_BRALA|nr:FAM155B [Branchiostoma lanceolatum]